LLELVLGKMEGIRDLEVEGRERRGKGKAKKVKEARWGLF
jgi:hypothetical protein